MGKYNKRASYAPKRNIVKAIFNFNNDMEITVRDTTLFTAVVDCTLVRTIFDVSFWAGRLVSPGVQIQWAGSYARHPNGVPVAPAPKITHGAYTDVPDELISYFGGQFSVRGSIEDQELTLHMADLFRDIKAMRKLQKGDKLVWRDIATVSGLTLIVGVVTMFFKET